jgi:hypothetical protein
MWSDALGGSWTVVQTGNLISGSAAEAPFSWTVNGTITDGVATMTASNPVGSEPGIVAASTIKLVFTAGCASANGTETITFPAGHGDGPTQSSSTTHLSRTTAVPSINLSFDISSSQNQIKVTLVGTGKTANLNVKLSGGSSPEILNKANVGAGANQTYSFPRLKLPSGHYTQVVAQWDEIIVTIVSDVVVLGSTRFSQYNTPYESTCAPGTAVPVWVLSDVSACTWTPLNVNPTFRVQTNINGTGFTAGNQLLLTYAVTSQSCSSSLPPGAVLDTGVRPWPGNTYQVVPSVTGACGKTLYSGSSVATYPGPHDANTQFSCSSKILVLDSAGNTNSIKAVQDRCPYVGCGVDAPHIDTYTSAQACRPKAIDDLPLSPAFAISVK